MSHLFNLAYLLSLLALSPWLIWRSLTTGRYRHGLRAKLLGPSMKAGSNQPAVWFHGVSVGEIILLTTLIRQFQQRQPGYQVVVTSTTDSGLSEAKKRFPELQVEPFPFDFSWACRRAISAYQPELIVLVESELWPNFLAEANRSGVPVVVINGRMSPRSFRRLTRFRRVAYALLLKRVTLFAVQSQDYADRLRQLGVAVERITVTGSIKYDGVADQRDTPKARELASLLSLSIPETESHHGLLWVVGSTHAPEEAVAIQIFAKLRPRFPELRLLLVPRHPDRFDEVAELIRQSGLSWVRRSELTSPCDNPPDIMLLDTVGELSAAWALADAAYTGGSLAGKRGGQSMIEPAGLGVATLFGPCTWNFRDTVERLLSHDAAVQVVDEQELEQKLIELLNDHEQRQRIGNAARELIRSQQGATQRTLDLLDRLLQEANEKRSA